VKIAETEKGEKKQRYAATPKNIDSRGYLYSLAIYLDAVDLHSRKSATFGNFGALEVTLVMLLRLINCRFIIYFLFNSV